MGKISYASQYRDGPNAALVDILEKAAAASGYDVEFKSGYRAGDSRQHGKKNAIDVTLVDPATGKKIPDYQSGASFRTYEEFAQIARQVQQRDYPELSSKMRWGGYFSGGKGKYGALDLMHFDLAGDKIGMAGGNWDKGLTPAQRKLFPSAVSVGFKTGPVPPLGLTGEAVPVTANARVLDQKRTQFQTSLQQTPLPRPRPLSKPIAPPSLDGIARQGATSSAAMSATPRITDTDAEAAARRPPLDWGQFRPSVTAGGVGSLLTGGINPAAPNPVKAPVQLARPLVAPTMLMPAGRPDAPIGSLPAARPSAPIPLPRDARPSTPVVPSASFATLPNGKQVQVNKIYDIGGSKYVGGTDSKGAGTLTKIPESILGEAGKNTIVGGVIGKEVGKAVQAGKQTVSDMTPVVAKAVSDTAGGVATSVGDFFGGLFGGAPAVSKPAVKSTNATLNTAKAEQAALRKPVALPPPPPSKPKPQVVPVFNSNAAALADARSEQAAARGPVKPPVVAAPISPPVPLPRPATIPPAPPKTITVTRAAPLAPPPIAPLPRPYSDALMARANAMPKPLTLQEAVGSWWNGTALGQGINLVPGKAPPPQQSSGGLLGAVFGMVPRQAMAQATAKQAAKDPLGYAIGEANRKAAGPTYTVSGDNNSFMPASVQNSSRWQTGY